VKSRAGGGADASKKAGGGARGRAAAGAFETYCENERNNATLFTVAHPAVAETATMGAVSRAASIKLQHAATGAWLHGRNEQIVVPAAHRGKRSGAGGDGGGSGAADAEGLVRLKLEGVAESLDEDVFQIIAASSEEMSEAFFMLSAVRHVHARTVTVGVVINLFHLVVGLTHARENAFDLI
jgi:hypothetical protein